MKKYQPLYIEIIYLEIKDIILTSENFIFEIDKSEIDVVDDWSF